MVWLDRHINQRSPIDSSPQQQTQVHCGVSVIKLAIRRLVVCTSVNAVQLLLS